MGVYLCRFKVFFPLMVWGLVVLIPVNKTDNELASFQSREPNVIYTSVDNWSIANVHDLSERYVYSRFAFYVFYSYNHFISFPRVLNLLDPHLLKAGLYMNLTLIEMRKICSSKL